MTPNSASIIGIGPAAVAILLSTLSGPAPAAESATPEWFQYRGPDRNGITPETGWNAVWKSPPKELWKLEVGIGASSMSVAGGRLYTAGNIKDRDIVYCLDAATGKEIWRFAYDCKLAARQFEGGPAATPTIDGDRAYMLSHEGHLFCLDAGKGAKVWSLHVVNDLGGKRPTWGFAGSPLVVGEKLIVDIGGEGSSTVALDKKTGKVLWKAGDDGAGYGSPILFDSRGTPALAIFKAKAIVAQALADGAPLWSSPWETSYDVNATTPTVVGSRIFICSGYGRGASVIDFASGEAKPVWENKKMRNHFNSCLVRDGSIYGVDDGGEVKCIDFATGEVRWEAKGFGKGSLILAGDKLVILSEDGELVTAEASPAGYKELGRAKILKRKCWVSPVLAGGRIYARNNNGTLVCLDVRG